MNALICPLCGHTHKVTILEQDETGIGYTMSHKLAYKPMAPGDNAILLCEKCERWYDPRTKAEVDLSQYREANK